MVIPKPDAFCSVLGSYESFGTRFLKSLRVAYLFHVFYRCYVMKLERIRGRVRDAKVLHVKVC